MGPVDLNLKTLSAIPYRFSIMVLCIRGYTYGVLLASIAIFPTNLAQQTEWVGAYMAVKQAFPLPQLLFLARKGNARDWEIHIDKKLPGIEL